MTGTELGLKLRQSVKEMKAGKAARVTQVALCKVARVHEGATATNRSAPMNTMNHKGYTARIEFDERNNIFVGRVL
ncbi:hypothetical protein RZS08_34885, partial [Arthrospira platensis SPKY1]|nr:hypothetical protein [Arthrospira platensis SPKY1]